MYVFLLNIPRNYREDIVDVTYCHVPTTSSLAVETNTFMFLWLAHLNKKSNVCKQISSLHGWFGNHKA